MASPPPSSLVPAPTVWPPSNPSGTVIPFPLPWGQTGCCPPGGMDALMKCYCDIQQASAFIGQVMLDQINNNPAIIAAIIAGIEKSGSSLPTIGVTNGSDAQPGQVGEWVIFSTSINFTTTSQTTNVSMGVLQPGDWTCWAYAEMSASVSEAQMYLPVIPAGFGGQMLMQLLVGTGFIGSLVSPTTRALISVPTLVPFQVTTVGTSAGAFFIYFMARRAR